MGRAAGTAGTQLVPERRYVRPMTGPGMSAGPFEVLSSDGIERGAVQRFGLAHRKALGLICAAMREGRGLEVSVRDVSGAIVYERVVQAVR